MTVEAAIEALRPALASDGFDLRLDSVDESRVVVLLEAKPGACPDCIVPDDVLVSILDNAIKEAGAGPAHVTLTKVGFERLTPPSTESS